MDSDYKKFFSDIECTIKYLHKQFNDSERMIQDSRRQLNELERVIKFLKLKVQESETDTVTPSEMSALPKELHEQPRTANSPSTQTAIRQRPPSMQTAIRQQLPSTATVIRQQPPSTQTAIRQQQPSTQTAIRQQPPSTATAIRQQPPSTATAIRQSSQMPSEQGIVVDFNALAGQEGHNLKTSRDDFIRRYKVRAFNCTNFEARMNEPVPAPKFVETPKAPSGEYWAAPLRDNMFAVFPNVKTYSDNHHTARAMGEVFNSNFTPGRTYKNIAVEKPAIFFCSDTGSSETVWSLKTPGTLRLG